VVVIVVPGIVFGVIFLTDEEEGDGEPMLVGTRATPSMGLRYNSGASADDGTYINMTWAVESVTRTDIVWGDILFTVSVCGTPYTRVTSLPNSGQVRIILMTTAGTSYTVSGTGTVACTDYARGGDSLLVTLPTADSGDSVEITLIYYPTRSSAGSDSATAPSF
jgi:hypothetical protein